jgi:MFS family permease
MSSSPQASRIAISAVFFINGMLLAGALAYFPFVKETLHVGPKEIGLSLLLPPLGAVLTLPLLGRWTHLFGSRSVCIFTGIALCLLIPLIGLVSSLLSFRVWLFLVGVLNSNFDASMNTQSVEIQELFQKPVLSAIHGFWSVGGFVGAAGTGLAASLKLPPWAHLAMASLVCLAALLLAVRALVPHQLRKDAEAPSFVLPKGVVLFVGVVSAVAFMAEGAGWDWAAIYLRSDLRAPEFLASLGIAVFSGSMALARFFGDALVHRLGNVRTMQVGAVATSASLLLAVHTSSIPLAIASFALAGFSLSNIVPLLFRAAGSIPGHSVAEGVGGMSTCAYSASLIAPPAVGLIADRSSLSTALTVVGASTLAIAFCARPLINRTSL